MRSVGSPALDGRSDVIGRGIIIACLALAVVVAGAGVISYVRPLRTQHATSARAMDLVIERGRARVLVMYCVPRSSPENKVNIDWPRVGFVFEQNASSNSTSRAILTQALRNMAQRYALDKANLADPSLWSAFTPDGFRAWAYARGLGGTTRWDVVYVKLPLWMPVFLFLVLPATVVAVRSVRRRRRRDRGLCERCGYDLRGSVSGRCPECGREALCGSAL